MNRLGLIISRKKILIAFIILVVLACTVFFWYFRSLKDKTNEQLPQVLIYTASRDISAGEQINQNMLNQEKISADVYSDKFLTDTKDIYGKKALETIEKGEIINSENIDGAVYGKEQNLRFSSFIPAGHRAATIPVSYYGQVSLLNRGDKVDIISTYYDDETENVISRTVLGYKEIILLSGNFTEGNDSQGSILNNNAKSGDSAFLTDLINQGSIYSPDSGPLIITLYLTPAESEEIMLYLQLGTLNIVLCPD